MKSQMIKVALIAPKRSGHVFLGNMIKSWFCEIYYRDLENVHPDEFASSAYRKEIDTVVLSTRDLLNWFASYITKREMRVGGIVNFKSMVKHWIAITKEFYGETNYLQQFKVHHVLYDRFIADQQYRKEICNDLGARRYNEAMMNVVAVGASGSSFSGFDFDGKAEDLEVLKRYKQFEHKDLYRRLFTEFPDLYKFYKKYQADEGKLKFLRKYGIGN